MARVATRELWELSAAELLAGYRAREFSPREVVDALLARIDRVNPALGAFTTVCAERAQAEADGALGDERPLAGVPFAAKELFDTAGVRTTYGSQLFARHVPERDAAAVAAMRAAGAILVGKTQTHEFAWGITTINEAMGSTRNPWAPDRIPGGSSGGSGAALAARLVPLALGSDTGGSIRIPAAFCGVTGLKPTYGRIATTGIWPLAPSLDHAGPMARTVDDLELAFAAMERRPVAQLDLGTLTVITCPDLLEVPPAPDLERVFKRSLATLESLGARVDERRLANADRFDEIFRVIQLREAWRVHADAELFPQHANGYGPDVRARLERAASISADAHAAAAGERESLRAAIAGLLGDGALLVTPVSGTAPVVAEQLGDGLALRDAVMRYTVPQNVTGIPSCALRAGFDDLGLPVGIQISAAPWRDNEVLAAAQAFFAATPEIQSRWPAVEE